MGIRMKVGHSLLHDEEVAEEEEEEEEGTEINKKRDEKDELTLRAVCATHGNVYREDCEMHK